MTNSFKDAIDHCVTLEQLDSLITRQYCVSEDPNIKFFPSVQIGWLGGRHFSQKEYSGTVCLNDFVKKLSELKPELNTKISSSIFRNIRIMDNIGNESLGNQYCVFRLFTWLCQFFGNWNYKRENELMDINHKILAATTVNLDIPDSRKLHEEEKKGGVAGSSESHNHDGNIRKFLQSEQSMAVAAHLAYQQLSHNDELKKGTIKDYIENFYAEKVKQAVEWKPFLNEGDKKELQASQVLTLNFNLGMQVLCQRKKGECEAVMDEVEQGVDDQFVDLFAKALVAGIEQGFMGAVVRDKEPNSVKEGYVLCFSYSKNIKSKVFLDKLLVNLLQKNFPLFVISLDISKIFLDEHYSVLVKKEVDILMTTSKVLKTVKLIDSGQCLILKSDVKGNIERIVCDSV